MTTNLPINLPDLPGPDRERIATLLRQYSHSVKAEIDTLPPEQWATPDTRTLREEANTILEVANHVEAQEEVRLTERHALLIINLLDREAQRAKTLALLVAEQIADAHTEII